MPWLIILVIGLLSCQYDEPKPAFKGKTYVFKEVYEEEKVTIQITFNRDNSFTRFSEVRTPSSISIFREEVDREKNVYHYTYDANTHTLMVKELIPGYYINNGGVNDIDFPSQQYKLVFNASYTEVKEAFRSFKKA